MKTRKKKSNLQRITKRIRRSKSKKTMKTKKTLKKVNCSPYSELNSSKNTCYTNNDLIKLKDLWNSRHSDNIIKSDCPKKIHEVLTEKLSRICDKESCWLNKIMNKDEIKKNNFLKVFAPKSPVEWKSNPNEWLSSSDITNVMRQYEKAYKCFSFIGPSPIDFDNRKLYGKCVWEELCNFNLGDYIDDKKNKIGIIFNTDPHYLDGSHWVSLFINIKKKIIFYFDSVGTKIPSEIKLFIERVKKQGAFHNISFKYESNYGFAHQKSNTECGVYSLYFIVQLLKDTKSVKDFKTKKFHDKYIEKFRKIYFNEKMN